MFCAIKKKLCEIRDFVFLLLPDVVRYSHPVDNGTITLEEWQGYMRDIYGSEREITFGEFEELLEDGISNMRNFRECTFEYYETGTYGCGWCTYTFESPEDLKLYREWLRSSAFTSQE